MSSAGLAVLIMLLMYKQCVQFCSLPMFHVSILSTLVLSQHALYYCIQYRPQFGELYNIGLEQMHVTSFLTPCMALHCMRFTSLQAQV